jgi:Holliday junction resolvase RusA-like endonuclease
VIYRLDVLGAPSAQGSMRPVNTPAGPRIVQGGSKGRRQHLANWRSDVADRAAADLANPFEPDAPRFKAGEPVAIAVLYRLFMPKRWRLAKGLRHDTPWLVAGKPDRDKLDRAIGDALTVAGVVWADDAQDGLGASAISYAPPGSPTGAQIWLAPAAEWFDLLSTFARACRRQQAELEARRVPPPMPRAPKTPKAPTTAQGSLL